MRVGISIAVKQAASIESSCVSLEVSSITRMMPVTGQRTTAVKNAAMPVTAKAVGSVASVGEPAGGEGAVVEAGLRAQHEQRREESARSAGRIGDCAEREAEREYDGKQRDDRGAVECGLRQVVAAADQVGPVPGQ